MRQGMQEKRESSKQGRVGQGGQHEAEFRGLGMMEQKGMVWYAWQIGTVKVGYGWQDRLGKDVASDEGWGEGDSLCVGNELFTRSFACMLFRVAQM